MPGSAPRTAHWPCARSRCSSGSSSEVRMRGWLFVALLAAAGSVLSSQAPLPREWIDADTGHRVVRLTDDAGGSTLYFHDNAFSPQGDTLMLNTPNGIAIVDIAKIGTSGAQLAIVASGARGG